MVEATRIGSEFLVNTKTEDSQSESTIIGLADGRFVVAWYDNNGDSSSVIKAQVFNAIGAKQGIEFLVNAQNLGFQYKPMITDLADGRFVITWEDYADTLGGSDVKAQAFSASGTKQGSEFLVNTQTAGDQYDPTITGLADGGFVIIWEENNDGTSIKGQRFSANGTKQGGEFLVNSQSTDDQYDPTITALSGGGFVVTWQSYNEMLSESEILAQMFSASGTKQGSEFLVNTKNAGYLYKPMITNLADDRFVITWEDYADALGGGDIKAQVFSANGAKEGNEFLVNTEATGDQSGSTITSLSNGGFVVAWQDHDARGESDVKAQVFAISESLFTEDSDIFDFTALTSDDIVRLQQVGPFGLYNALSGNDSIVLPNTSDYQLLPDITWDSSQTFHAGSGDDSVFGGNGTDKIAGDAGNDMMKGGGGADTLDGGTGVDIAIYAAMRTQSTITHANTTLAVSSPLDGIDTTVRVEQFQFADGLYSFTFKEPGAAVVANFNPVNGWSSQDQFPRHIADVNGDGFADVVGFGFSGVLVSFGSAGGSFSGTSLVVSNFGQTAGWTSDNAFHRELADVNGDGRDDILGFGFAGTLVSLARADGTFANPTTGIANFGTNQGWSSQNGFARTVGDVNGDGRADIIGFGFAGTLVSLGNGDGTFQAVQTGVANFGVAQGWTNDNNFHRAVADVNGDGRDDIIGFGIAGTLVSLSNGNGTFGTAQLVLNDFGVKQGWANNDAFPRIVADVNGDDIADIVGFGIAGTLVAYGKGDGTFTQAGFDLANFGTAQGWSSSDTFYRDIADVNNDGLADIIGFGIAGVLIAQNQGDFLL